MLDALPRLRERLADVRYRPIWSFLMRWDGGPAANVIKFDDELLNLAVRQTTDGAGLWVVHSTHAFAETYLDVIDRGGQHARGVCAAGSCWACRGRSMSKRPICGAMPCRKTRWGVSG